MSLATATSRADSPELVNRRLAWGLLLSLAFHALLLMLQFGVPGLGLPSPFRPPPVSITIVPPPPAPAPPAAPSVDNLPPLLPRAAASGMRLVDPAPAPPPVRLAPKPKPARPRRISRPRSPRPAAPAPTRVIAQDQHPNDSFAVPLPQPEEAVQKTADPTEAQAGTDDGADMRAAQLAEVAHKEELAALQAEEESRKQAELKLQEQQRMAEQELAQRTQAEEQARRLAAQQQTDERAAQRQIEQQAARRRADDLAREQQRQQQADQAVARQKQDELALRQKADELALRQKADEQAARLKSDELARQKVAEIAREQAQQAARQAEQVARQQAEQIAKQQAEQIAKQQAEQIAKQQAEQIAKEQAEKIAKEQAEQAARQQAEQAAAAGQRDRERAAAAAAQAGAGAAASGTGGTGATVPKNLLGSDVGNRVRELTRGIDLLGGAPPQRDVERGGRRVVVGSGEHDIPLRMYADSFRQKVERNGGQGYTSQDGGRARTDPLVSVALRSDGSVEDVTIVRSSGSADTDNAVRRIIRLNARYSAFPPNIAAKYDVIEVRRIWSFAETLRLLDELR